MKKVVDYIAIIFVGALFIFSGLIKVNDPVGTAIKLQEYFEVFATDFASFFHAFVPYSLSIAVFIVVLEVALGFAVLIRHQMKLTTWVLLLLILFFTALTFYSATTGKVTDCGCFGDAIKLTPWQSFYKDLILLVLIVYLFIRRKSFKPVFAGKRSYYIMLAVIAINVFLSIYAINHLPFIDFRAYKVGNNIKEAMQPSEEFRYKYIMEKDGETFEFEEYPTDESYEFKDMVLLNPEAQPKITDYNVWTDEGEFTEESLTGKKLFLIIQDVEKADLSEIAEIKALMSNLNKQLDIWILTSNAAATIDNFRHEYQIAASYYYADATVLKAMIRSNPGIMLLEDGTVLGKWHNNDVPEANEIINLLN